MVNMKLPALVATSALLVGVLLAPSAVQAQRGGGGAGRGGGGGNGAAMGRGAVNGRPAVAQQGPGRQWSGNQWSGNQWSHNHFVGRPFFRPFVRPLFPFAVAPSVVYAAPYYYPPYYDYQPPAYYDPPQSYYAPPAPTYYAPPATYSSPPPSGTVSVAPAPSDTVIQYSHGRYELRGDGISTPYRWVWIPNPPPPPPAAPPAPTGDPSSGIPSPGDPFTGSVAPRQSQLYRWTDTTGVVHWTDRIDMVPEKYRAGARQYPRS
jgi:Domain of unknown function (DUF4124)